MDFVAIDFETANERRCSPCALGLAVVNAGRVAETAYWLIRPKELVFNPYNIFIHGITEEDVRDKPELPDLWPTIRRYVEGKMVLAHNASFDMSVLRHTLIEYRIGFPEFQYCCTRIIAKKTWPGFPTYRLDFVAASLGVQFEHHQALEDALACAEIARRAIEVAGGTSVQELADRVGMRIGKMFPGGYEPASATHQTVKSGWRIDVKEITPTTSDFNPDHPLYDQLCAFTGTLRSMTRKQAMQRVVDVGGRVNNTVTKETNLLVVGDQDLRKFAEGETRSAKMKKAEGLIQKGADLEIICEEDFRKMFAE